MSNLPSEKFSKSFWNSEPSETLLGHRTTDRLPDTADVVIIGSGMTGTSVAWHFLEEANEWDKKPKVVLLEAREACYGATGRNGGHCQPIMYEHAQDPSIGRFELANFRAVQSMVKQLSIDCEFREQHSVHALYSENDLAAAKKSVAVLQENDPASAKRVSLVTEVSQLQDLRVPTAFGAIVTDIAGRMWPYKFVAGVLEKILSTTTSESFNLQTNTLVTAITSGGNEGQDPWRVTTPRGTITAKHVVLATNGYTSALLSEFEDLIVPCRGQMSALVPSDRFSGKNRLKDSFVFLGEGQDDYLIQRPYNGGEHLMFGGGRQLGPSLGISDDSEIDHNVAQYLRSSLLNLLGDRNKTVDAEELKAIYEWTGIMGYSRDARPWVGPHPELRGIFLSGGYTGHGMPNTWLCGRAAAQMVIETIKGTSADDTVAAALAGSRFGLPKAYVLDADRIKRARKLDSVQKQDSGISGMAGKPLDR